jgi:hypothetical protein
VEVDTARLETSQFKNGFAKCVLLYYLVVNSRVLLMYTDTVKELLIFLYRTLHLGVSFFEGGLSAVGE